MSLFTYTATLELSPGTAQDASVVRNFRLLSFPRTYRSIKKQNTAIGGVVESVLSRSEKHYQCLTENITPGSLIDKQIFEFFASVQNGEGFTFDRRGTVAQPDEPVACIMVSSSMGEAERGKKFYQYRFVIRET